MFTLTHFGAEVSYKPRLELLTKPESMKLDVEEYIRYYNHERQHTTLEDLTPISYEKLQSKVSGWT
ncbi:transposase [Shewanella psychropiezotolerans]|uniref:Transposase n=1 Tax=Shewanella psychropiezotolerans TaxID=2593655 RepID=A0ABX5WVH1_9GAMM|nr:transposase [Shewanella psychropiezotolerans]